MGSCVSRGSTGCSSTNACCHGDNCNDVTLANGTAAKKCEAPALHQSSSCVARGSTGCSSTNACCNSDNCNDVTLDNGTAAKKCEAPALHQPKPSCKAADATGCSSTAPCCANLNCNAVTTGTKPNQVTTMTCQPPPPPPQAPGNNLSLSTSCLAKDATGCSSTSPCCTNLSCNAVVSGTTTTMTCQE